MSARTIFLGSGAFGRECLRRLSGHSRVHLVGVVTAPTGSSGRGRRGSATPIADLARELGLEPVLAPARLRAPESLAVIDGLEPELVVLADYGQIVPARLLELRYGALNLHPSLLPRHRGASPIPAAILAGDDDTGVTLIRMDAGLDTGPIIAQERVTLTGRETAPDLEAALEVIGAGLLERNLGSWIDGRLTARPQPTTGVSLTRPLRREDGRLDPTRSSARLERQIRAYQPWPGSFVDTELGRVVVWDATVEADGPDASRFDRSGLGTSDGCLALCEVQAAGGRRMSWAAYLLGRPGIVGSRVVDRPD